MTVAHNDLWQQCVRAHCASRKTFVESLSAALRQFGDVDVVCIQHTSQMPAPPQHKAPPNPAFRIVHDEAYSWMDICAYRVGWNGQVGNMHLFAHMAHNAHVDACLFQLKAAFPQFTMEANDDKR